MKHNYILILLTICVSSLSLAQISESTILDPTDATDGIPLPPDRYESSVILIRDYNEIRQRSTEGKQALTFTMVNFDKRYKLLPAYLINGIEYCDNGRYNDAVAGDGVFTSVQKYNVTLSKSANGVNISKGSNFAYEKDLQKYINRSLSGRSDSGIEVKCKIRTITCPETNWWNSCWPLSSPCTCIDFYDCEISVDISIDII